MGVPVKAFMEDLKGLPPGFRFHPTDEELVCHYLKQKSSKSSKHKVYLDLITEIDLYKHEPSDLPGRSCFAGRGGDSDKEWFFFTQGDCKKYPTGSRLNRATQGGYWKTTGRDREVFSKGLIVGMKKTLVFHTGRAPQGKRTHWIMHEYRLVNDPEAAKFSSWEKDSFVLCRVFLKNGIKKNTKEQNGDFYEGENSTLAGYTVVTDKEQHENMVVSPEKEVEINDRDLPFGPFTASSEENCLIPDDDLQKFLLECLHDPDEETGDELLQIPTGGARSSLFDEPFSYSNDIDTLNDEASVLTHGFTVDPRIHAENSVPLDDFIHGDTSEVWDFDRYNLSPSVLAGDFLELKDLMLPL